MNKLIKYGDKTLRKIPELLILPDKSHREKIDEMVRICVEHHGYAIAGNQIGWDAKAFIVRMEHITGKDEVLVIFNPELIGFSEEEVDFDESCLSLPSIKVKIRRPNEVRIKYFTEEGKEEIIEGKGLLARVFQHEMDHLRGKLIIDYMTPLEKTFIKNKLKRIKRGQFD